MTNGPLRTLSLVLMFALVACTGAKSNPDVIEEVAAELVRACPTASPSDESARDRCADEIARSQLLVSVMNESILWGGHDASSNSSIDPNAKHLTRFSAFVFRRIYMSTFTFSGVGSIEKIGSRTVLRMPVRFRNQMTSGAYPYPFWHSESKWTAYQSAVELWFVWERGRIVAVYRSGDDRSRDTDVRGTFDGNWRWVDEDSSAQPYVSLFAYLFSANNPHLQSLDTAYRALEREARENTCLVCHAPDNSVQMMKLVLLTYPNQALGDRHELVEVFTANSMPPNLPLPAETLKRMQLLSTEFARVGDLAVAFEGVSVAQ